MIIIPDLFTPYVEGVELARKANWDDLNNYNKVQKGQLDNLFELATFSPKVNREYESTDKLALENLFNEETFQNRMLNEILKARELEARIGWYGRRGTGTGTTGAATPANPGGTAASNPAGSGLPTPTGQTAKTSQTPPGTPASANLEVERQKYAEQYGLPIPKSPLDSYLLDESRGKMARTPFTPMVVNRAALDNIQPLAAGRTPLGETERVALEANGVAVSNPSVYANMKAPFTGYYDTSGFTQDQWGVLRGLQENQGVWIDQNNFATKRGDYLDIFPVVDGSITHRYTGRFPTVQVQ